MADPLSPEAFATAYALQQDQNSADKHLHVLFEYDEIEDEEATKRAGRPMFRSVEMCEIRYGDKDNVVRDRVKYMHPDPRQRFPAQYARFKAGEKVQVVGTLLREWGLVDRATAKGYEAVGIVTVEQLAGLSDANAQQVRGSIADRQKARDFLEMAKGLAPVAQARAEFDKAQEQIRALRDELDAMKAAQDDKPQRRQRSA